MKFSIEETALSQPAWQKNFISGKPFPLLVMDNFIPKQIAENLCQEIGKYKELQKSNDYIFAKNKFEDPGLESLGPTGRAIKKFLLSEDVRCALSSMYGRDVFVDPDFLGGGLHRGGEGSFLDMHTDFNLHPVNKKWIRELNILLYLNRDWKPEYGGRLDLRNADTGEETSIDPIFNRMVIMLTKDFTIHGYKPISFPIGTYRTSIAAYAYSLAANDDATASLRTTTTWVPEGGGKLKTILAKITPRLVAIKQRFLGSATARKR